VKPELFYYNLAKTVIEKNRQKILLKR